ncbi:unnamed protein product [Brugia pahangi]|uniref:Uncharacterized protein n=1 Tax=Brugia pahangi TaxID=6280 RepID=A0A0N4TE47_BRUPA|nr:unnamed protein product [Brugia pahangi]
MILIRVVRNTLHAIWLLLITSQLTNYYRNDYVLEFRKMTYRFKVMKIKR